MKQKGWFETGCAIVILALALGTAAAEDEIRITIKEHRFIPSEVRVKANTRLKLIIVNEDSTPEEFESYELNREEIIDGNETITIFIGPLKAGKYEYFGEFHKETAQGVIVAQ